MEAAKTNGDEKQNKKKERLTQLRKDKEGMAKVHEKLEQSARIRRRFQKLGSLIIWKDENAVGQPNMFQVALNHEVMMIIGESWTELHPDKATQLTMDISRHVVEKFYNLMGKKDDILGMTTDSSGMKKIFNYGMRYRFQGEKSGHRATCIL